MSIATTSARASKLRRSGVFLRWAGRAGARTDIAKCGMPCRSYGACTKRRAVFL
jgi:hypothetical protein